MSKPKKPIEQALERLQVVCDALQGLTEEEQYRVVRAALIVMKPAPPAPEEGK